MHEDSGSRSIEYALRPSKPHGLHQESVGGYSSVYKKVVLPTCFENFLDLENSRSLVVAFSSLDQPTSCTPFLGITLLPPPPIPARIMDFSQIQPVPGSQPNAYRMQGGGAGAR